MAKVIIGCVVFFALIGFVWGRVSARIKMPELMRMLTAPLVCGCVSFCVAFVFFLFKVGPKGLSSSMPGEEGSAIGFLLRSGFAGGAVAGAVPSIFGWTLGYRRARG